MILWKPTGLLDISTNASDLPEVSAQFSTTSEALTRCKNLRQAQTGVTKLRDGSSKINASAINTAIWLLMEQAGTRYAFAGDSIYRNEVSIASGLTQAQWSAIKYNQFNDTDQQIFALNGTDRKRINSTTVAEWGITAPSAAPTTAVGASTGLTGDYNAKTTYCRKVGSVVVSESNPSAAGTTRTLTNDSFSVTWVASSDSQVTHVRVYRTLADGLVYFHDQDIAVGTLTVDTNTTDANLGNELETDHDRPPLGSFVLGPNFDGTSFILKDNLLYFSKAQQPEYWPATSFVEIGPPQLPNKSACFYNGQTYVGNKADLYNVLGTASGTFLPVKMQARTGVEGIFGMVSVSGYGIFHTGNDGVYLFAGGQDINYTYAMFYPIFRGETVNGMPAVSEMESAVLHSDGTYLYFAYTSSGSYSPFPTNVIVLNLETKKLAYYVYNDGSDIAVRCMVNDETNKRVLIGDNTGFVRKIQDTSVTTDSGTAISWETQSKDFTLSTRPHFPRWQKYDVDASGATSCTGSLLLDGETHQEHTIIGNRVVKRRLVPEGNGERCAIKLSGSGPISIYAVESE